MSAKQTLSDFLQHMRHAAMRACRVAEEREKDAFLVDEDAVEIAVWNITIIGEAAAKIRDRYPEFVAAHPEIPWKDMRAMRNQVIHDYFEIDYDIVWDVLQTDLPELLEQLSKIEVKE